jgi:hypothetical protein
VACSSESRLRVREEAAGGMQLIEQAAGGMQFRDVFREQAAGGMQLIEADRLYKGSIKALLRLY